ncbi:phosphatidate cytidylyltransferase [Synchytrium endobioticum]|uniref:Phosphatidate cytidylyltransferase, mitochondrial n=1 Tax=Synchytrium endobioticum TaxID=286115 RepID=A0A507DDR0_9FUNG|nr:phosphatidate cytidylyltransferase [Synchytrium endobioticum]TPX49822.1 phosphatidate cytidylyltransferase [Synchytrium endobioticum]
MLIKRDKSFVTDCWLHNGRALDVWRYMSSQLVMKFIKSLPKHQTSLLRILCKRSHTTGPAFLQGHPDPFLRVISAFDAPIRYAIAYGSGVFPQQGQKKENSMIDFIFGVTHPEHWHSLNIRQNPQHYSFLSAFGSRSIAILQERVGAGLYYNPDVNVNGMNIKYGVISMEGLLQDLKCWETLYVAGRMQKPTLVLRDDARVKLANEQNLRNAVRAALLLLPHEFTEEDLFLTIVALSYHGDFRMRVGENPRKVYNIVHGQLPQLQDLYRPVVEHLPNVVYFCDDKLQQDDDVKLRALMLQQLPKGFFERIGHHHRWYLSRVGYQNNAPQEESAFSQSIVESPEIALYTQKALAETIRWPALSQSLKGILTAGLVRSWQYVLAKLKKRSR